ncbi:hypothetical protein GAYE_SCF46G5804 [Galdieria yellowstonensis]|uniref:Splicing factor 3A subunit 1 n=1 Tax=Galdieria yellowstonensis TaxID=3028027 RepID=A0AAV9IKU3_9RHOD|nr:hypothetical protein GAYE_SCF46G5804 [Galdieria yellowstonensis]
MNIVDSRRNQPPPFSPSQQSVSNTTGMIPPDVEKIIEKTAIYVAKNGSSFEARVLEMNRNNPKFSFLLESDPFHSYYLQILQEKRRYFAGASATPTSSAGTLDHAESQPNLREGESIAEAAPAVSKAKLSERKAQAARPVPTQPPPEDVFSAPIPEEPLPSPLDVDIMKLTAQFIARNGRSFLQELHMKEYRNPQFEFLKPSHPYFSFFQRLVDAYSVVIAPDDQMLQKLKESAHSLGKVMEDLYYRVDWEILQEEKKAEQNRSAMERVQMQLIDWHDFVIVETIDLDERETNLPAPAKGSDVAHAWKEAERMNGNQMEANMEQDDMEMDMQEEEEQVEVTAYTDIPADKIRKDYRPRTAVAGDEQSESIKVTLPSGQRVPLDRANESIKMELLDPKYKEERQRAAEKNKYQNLASDAEVAMNLGRLSDQKLDIYNRADLQSVMAQRRMTEKSGEGGEAMDWQVKAPEPTVPPKPSSLLWESSASHWEKSEEATMRDHKMEDNVSNGEDNSDEGIQVHVRVQSHSNQEWNLRGQTISLQVPYQATILDLKSTLAPIVKLPPNKQKISADNFGYLKDNLSLSDYQFYDGIVMYLEVKERGGKKK